MIKLKKSPVVFDDDKHTYKLDGKPLSGITSLIHSVLGLGVYPDASDYVKDRVIPKAGSRGTAVHRAIQIYDELGMIEPNQIVNTRYGCTARNNIEYELLEWDVTNQLNAYMLHQIGFKPLANELTVSDNKSYASQIDNVWLNEATNGIWLVDTKTNNIDRYPLCGYFKPDYFASGEEALKEYLSWQLSIYAELFEAENPGLKVEGLACNWLREDDHGFWEIERKPTDKVKSLLSTEWLIADSGFVYLHPNLDEVCKATAEVVKVEECLPILPVDVINCIYDLVETERKVKSQLDEMKKSLREAMEQHGVKTWDSGLFKATIAKDSEVQSFDSTKFKKDHPDLYKQYQVKKIRQGGFTIKSKSQQDD